ncbi:MAG TPA: DegT/DnrJ/EryC1/StrS aminotransferase family protein [Polyangiales bacterium]|nr:DegT/DnrJ/EryC1/StrS aminotransferase family protein [Polyangiales bacterium]
MIPLSRPVLGAEEVSAIAAVLATGRLVQGEQVAAFERAVAERLGRKHALAVANGTAALRVALEALGVSAGDRVLVPDLTWPSPAHAVLELGAVPVLVDVDEHEWNVTPRSLATLEPSVLRGLRAAIAIDQFGYPARARELERMLPGVPLLVDAACSLGSYTGEVPCGALGAIATHSFHPRKLLTTGEGGMCLTDDPELAARIAELRNHGQRAPGNFARGSGNHRLSEMAAAMGLVQLSRLSGMVEARARLAARYESALGELSIQRCAPGARPNYQTFGVLLPAGVDRDQTVAALRAREVESGRLSYALHSLPQFAAQARDAQARGQRFDQSSALAERGIALPLWPGLSDADQDRVIDALRAVLRERN